MKKKGLISFSGGETSGFMLWWLLNNKSHEYDFKVVFANTGRENEATLDFVKKCGEQFGVEIVWIESNVWGASGQSY
jgi:3'-phosphoadenosine 5'-phosphosulfate sulfotransferase (PAPS reductase)/FAD synthetase